jgi:GMP synthase (glutamine-hydrolysing)
VILIIDVCLHRLSSEQFVRPITDIVSEGGRFKVVHYTKLTEKELDDCDKLIICGTALHDDDYLEHLDSFEFLESFDKPVLGICAGMQVIGLVHGSKVMKATEIGMVGIKVKKPFLGIDTDIEAYSLHNNSISLPAGFETLAESDSCIHAIKHKTKRMYGVLFHPEARNKGIIQQFIRL